LKNRTLQKGEYWSVNEAINVKGDSIQTSYFYKGKKAKRIEISSPIAQKLSAYALIEKDLRNVLVWLNEIDNIRKNKGYKEESMIMSERGYGNIIKGLYVASLVSYGKCFVQCEGRKTKLEKKSLDVRFHKIHDDIMHQRHNFAAHSGIDSYEEVKVAAVIPSEKGLFLCTQVYTELLQIDFALQPKGEISFIDLVNHVREIVLSKKEELQDRILIDEVLSKGEDYWLSKK
jgi:hypothetical protein